MSMSLIAGYAFVAFLVVRLYKKRSIFWNHLETTYSTSYKAPTQERWGQAVMYGHFFAARIIKTQVKIGANNDGISLRAIFPLDALFRKPLFIPYRDIRGWDESWFINSKTVELDLLAVPEVKIAMPRDEVEWIKNVSGGKFMLMGQNPPQKTRPTIWYMFAIFFVLAFIPMTIAATVYFLVIKNIL